MSFISHGLLKSEPITLRLTDFYIFMGQFVSKKKKNTINKNFMPIVKLGFKQGKTTLIVK